jgi:hypothetical protein
MADLSATVNWKSFFWVFVFEKEFVQPSSRWNCECVACPCLQDYLLDILDLQLLEPELTPCLTSLV